MRNQLYPTDLTDRQWELIKEVMPAAKPGGRPRTLDMRRVLNALLSGVVGGRKGRRLPRAYPKWQSVSPYCRPWRDRGPGHRLPDPGRARLRQPGGRPKPPTAGGRDRPSVTSTASEGERGYEAGQQVHGRKRPRLVETLGLGLAGVVRVASGSDPAGARLLLRRWGGACKKLRVIGVEGASRGQWRAGGAAHGWLRLPPG